MKEDFQEPRQRGLGVQRYLHRQRARPAMQVSILTCRQAWGLLRGHRLLGRWVLGWPEQQEATERGHRLRHGPPLQNLRRRAWLQAH